MAVTISRKKSPRAPSLSLDDALSKALIAYDRDRLHAGPTEVVAQNIGYKSANNGTALSALASLRYFGLLERPREGFLSVTKEVETYKFAPNEDLRRATLIGFLRRPQLYAELLEKFESGLPSDANLKFELIQRGFAPQAAEAVLAAFKRSVDFAKYFESVSNPDHAAEYSDSSDGAAPSPSMTTNVRQTITPEEQRSYHTDSPPPSEPDDKSRLDRIPVRLPGGRRAWLVIPTPFFSTDKDRLKAQIDLLLTEEDEQ